jgi:hypothetical protein
MKGPSKPTSKHVAAAKGDAWVVVVRLANGSRQYLHFDNELRGPEGTPLERWSPRETQAQRFPTEEVAKRVATSMSVNSAAKEYLVVKLG